MWQAIGLICLIAFVGSMLVPITLLTLAQFGMFEPIEINVFGRHWRFAPTDTGSVT